jgi:hypothetical protein
MSRHGVSQLMAVDRQRRVLWPSIAGCPIPESLLLGMIGDGWRITGPAGDRTESWREFLVDQGVVPLPPGDRV